MYSKSLQMYLFAFLAFIQKSLQTSRSHTLATKHGLLQGSEEAFYSNSAKLRVTVYKVDIFCKKRK